MILNDPRFESDVTRVVSTMYYPVPSAPRGGHRYGLRPMGWAGRPLWVVPVDKVQRFLCLFAQESCCIMYTQELCYIIYIVYFGSGLPS